MPHHTRWQVAGPHQHPILGDTHLPDGEAKGAVVLAHGFKGYKDYGFFPRLAEAIAEAGLIAHRFNFSFSGMTHDIATFAKPELFEQDTWGKQQDDLMRIVHHIEDRSLPGAGLPLTVFGHSRGGLSSILATAALGDRVAGLITAAAVADAIRLSAADQEKLLRDGRLPSPSGRTGQTLYVGKGALEEVLQNPDRFDAVKAIQRVTAQTHIIHGEADETVLVQDAHRLAAAKPDAKLTLIPTANHVFNGTNPMPMNKPAADAICQRFIETVVAACVSQ